MPGEVSDSKHILQIIPLCFKEGGENKAARRKNDLRKYGKRLKISMEGKIE